MKEIPKIIHQVWESPDGNVPEQFQAFSETWKDFNPDWSYRLWDKQAMEDLLKNFYPESYDFFISYPYNLQRWDAIRYFILYHFGGIYADMDYECLEA